MENRRSVLMVYGGSVLVLCLMLSGVDGSHHQGTKAHYCGTVLSDTLAKLCSSFTGLRKKADSPVISYGDEEYFNRLQLLGDVRQDVEELRQLQDRSEDTIYRALISLDSLNSNGFHRVRRQVVKECCIQSCTHETLRTYCADD
ncbi:uncharacterized protein LOC131285872 [Anopheles ziemanni]|nr:uncharacterized protein LOC131285872 [Anopheles ziemanni]